MSAKIKADMKKLYQGAWVEISLKPSKILAEVFEIHPKEGTISVDIDGNSNRTREVHIDDIDVLKKVGDPVEINFAKGMLGAETLRRFPDGRIFLGDREIDKKEAQSLFEALGAVLDYEIAS